MPNGKGRLAVYATKPEASESLDDIKGVVLVDTTYGVYSISRISFSFARHENAWKIDEPVYISPDYSKISSDFLNPPQRFKDNFNSDEAARKAWKDAVEKGVDKTQVQTFQPYLCIPASQFLSGYRREIFDTIKKDMPENLDALVQKLKPGKVIYLDKGNIPLEIAYPELGRVLLHFVDRNYTMHKQYR